MSTDSSSAFADAGAQDWASFLHPSAPAPAVPSPAESINNQASPAQLSTPSPSSASTPSDRKKNADRRVANLLTLTELRKAAWSRIYASGIKTGDTTISTSRVPTWRQFDALMAKRHRYIAVDPRDNRTLGWIACFHPYPHLSPFYDDPQQPDMEESEDGRGGRVIEIQVMVADAERNRGVGTFLVESLLASLRADRAYSAVQASFFSENEASAKLFQKCGFEPTGTRTNAVRMLDGPTKGTWRDLVTVDLKLPPLPTIPSQQPQQQQQQEDASDATPPVIDMTVDPNALFKRQRLD